MFYPSVRLVPGCEVHGPAGRMRLDSDDPGPHGSGAQAHAAGPSPATHATLPPLKAGESVFHIFSLTKTVVHALCYIEGQNHCFMHYFGVKTLSE